MKEFSESLVWWITALGVTSYYLARHLPVYTKSVIRFAVFSSWVVVLVIFFADHDSSSRSLVILILSVPVGFLIGYGLEKIAEWVAQAEVEEHDEQTE